MYVQQQLRWLGHLLGIVRWRYADSFGDLHALGWYGCLLGKLPDPDDLAVVQHPVLLQLLLEYGRLEQSGRMRHRDPDSFGLVPAFGRRVGIGCILRRREACYVSVWHQLR